MRIGSRPVIQRRNFGSPVATGRIAPVVRHSGPQSGSTWFPSDGIPRTVTHNHYLITFGRRGLNVISEEPFTDPIRRQMYHFLHDRGLDMKRTWESTQEEVVLGLSEWMIVLKDNLSHLEHIENMVNERIVWRPFAYAPVEEADTLQSAFGATIYWCESILRGGAGHLGHGLAVEMTRAAKHGRRSAVIYKDGFHDLFTFNLLGDAKRYNRALREAGLPETLTLEKINENRARLGKAPLPEMSPERRKRLKRHAEEVMKYIPARMDLGILSQLATMIMDKEQGVILTGAPGRMALIPTMRQRQGRSLAPSLEFAMALMPVDPELHNKLKVHQKLAHGHEAKEERHGQESPGYLPAGLDVAGVFPGALAYARVALLLRNKHMKRGIIEVVNSDVMQHAPEYAPPQLCRQIIGLAEALLESFHCHRLHMPTLPTVIEQCRMKNVTDYGPRERLNKLAKRLRNIYGTPPGDWNPVADLLNDTPYWFKKVSRK